MRLWIVPALVLGAEVLAGMYLTLVVWLISGWMVDDNQAAQMAPRDWYFEGARRLATALMVAGAFAVAALAANRLWVTPRTPDHPRLGTRIAQLLAAGIALAGAAGVIRFVVIKPWF